ncbi:MAG: tetratricopeptide repeat protein [Taibaiella sp.]|nr:tetratricopeptide repeat protein [Taibaiella sp.]
MKKAILIAFATIASVTGLHAQEKFVTDARLELQEKNPVKAKEYIEKAILDPTTKNEAKTWLIRADVYFALQNNPAAKDPLAYREAAASLENVIRIRADYEKETVTKNLQVCAYLFFNDGIVAYNVKNFPGTIDLMKKTIAIHDIENGRRYAGNLSFDTVAAQARLVEANSAYFSNHYEDALPLLLQLKTSPVARTPAVYTLLADIYTKQKNDAASIASIQEGRIAYPDDATLRNLELNYYIRSGKEEEMIKKLEAALATDPNNKELLYALAAGYNTSAFPASGVRPANFSEYVSKAEINYQKALQLAPDNTDYHYNLGALYYNQASEINKQINLITGNTPADLKKYEVLKAQRDAMFTKALPDLEKTYHLYQLKQSSLSTEDHDTYQSTMIALKEIYVRLNKMDKANEMKKNIESFR